MIKSRCEGERRSEELDTNGGKRKGKEQGQVVIICERKTITISYDESLSNKLLSATTFASRLPGRRTTPVKHVQLVQHHHHNHRQN